MSKPAPRTLKSRMRQATVVTQETLGTPLGRLWAYLLLNLEDHGFLRVFWTNLYEIAPGVWRSNQPGPRRMARYAQMGFKSIVILRGKKPRAHYALQIEAAEKLGLKVHEISLQARNVPNKDRFLDLFAIFRQVQGPWVMHCKSGADRAGLASAIYLLWKGASIDEARQQLSWKYFHLRSTHTGILDLILDHYEEASSVQPIGIEEWFKTGYDQTRLRKEFAMGRRHGKPWPRG